MNTRRESADVELIIEDERWTALKTEDLVRCAVQAAIEAAGDGVAVGDVAVLACNDERIKALNDRFRGKDEPTNVLAWPTIGGVNSDHLGDIAVSWESCAREARSMARDMSDHVAHLIVHGCLHLLGHRHDSECEETRMRDHEVKALAFMGIANPYLADGWAQPPSTV